MALFGRRKPGFSKEVELKPSEIPGEFSDALDPAINKALDNPKLEKQQLQQAADAVIDSIPVPLADPAADAETAGGASAPAASLKPDLFDYLQSLPDTEDPFPPSPPEPELPPEPEKTKAQLLADFIRERCRSALITPRSLIARDEEENADSLIGDMLGDESCADIRSVQGRDDLYFYSDELMANNYAKIAMLTLEKDDARTVAEMVRFNCRAFPTPTPVYYFARQPFFLDREKMKTVVAQMKSDPAYRDIRECTAAINGEPYLYSIDLMSEKYARALANGAESREADD